MREAQIIDPEALERLREWGGDKLLSQMIRLFLKNAGARMDQIRNGVRNGDVSEAEQGAHSLKSSSANVGAERVRALATRIEAAAVEGDVTTVSEALPEIEVAFAEAIAELEAMEREFPDES